LIGKITVLKSLAFSKIIYQCGVITCPPKFVELITNLAYTFIWSNKPDKIKRRTLIAEYEKGGLRMLDINSFLKAQKAMWAKRLMTPGKASWKAIPMVYLDTLMGIDTFKCNMNCLEKPKNFPGFYWQILQSWNEVKKIANQVTSAFDVRSQWLWLNQQILINKKQITWNNLHNHGINIINDIVNDDGTFLSVKKLESMYDIKCDIFKFNALKDAIPIEWRKMLKLMKIPREVTSANQTAYLTIGKISKPIWQITNKEIYWILVRNIQVKPIILNKLSQVFGLQESHWESIFILPRIMRDTRIRAFQYKILFNLVPCNLYLKRIKKSDTDKCAECQELDDIVHYFCECPPVRYFWNSFIQWWNRVNNTNVSLDAGDILLGIVDDLNKNELINACILLAKWHIYKKNLNASQIFFYNFLCDLRYHIMNEKTIALRNNQLNKHNMMWQIIEDELT
jgi:hypothetical protein